MRKDCSVGQRTGGNIEDVDGGPVPSAGDSNAPNGESRDSSTEQPRKGGTQQWASPRGGAHRAGECPGPEVQHHGMYFLISRASLLQSRSLGLVAVAAGRDLLVMPAGWLGPALGIHPSMYVSITLGTICLYVSTTIRHSIPSVLLNAVPPYASWVCHVAATDLRGVLLCL